MEEITLLLSRLNLRATQPRLELFRMLSDTSEPLSIRELTHRIPMIDRGSIYRTLELFKRLNVITVVHVGWKKRYELAAAYQKHHHHHLICTQCKEITEINSERLEDVIEALTGAHQFTPTGHTFEITGLCDKCATSLK